MLAILVGAGVTAWAYFPEPPPPKVDNSNQTRILLVGNSLTEYNDLHRLLGGLARAADCKAFVGKHVILGSRLSEHIPKIEHNELLKVHPWDYVVLQDSGLVAAFPKYRDEHMVPSLTKLQTMVEDANAHPILFMTWGHKDGAARWDPSLSDYEKTQTRITEAYWELGKQFAMPIAPIGEAWQNAMTTDSDLPLWHADGSHPGPYGSYLAACVLYAQIFDASPVGLDYYGDIPESVAKTLQKIAFETVTTTAEKQTAKLTPASEIERTKQNDPS